MIDNGMDGRMTELYNVAVIMPRFEKNMEGKNATYFKEIQVAKATEIYKSW